MIQISLFFDIFAIQQDEALPHGKSGPSQDNVQSSFQMKKLFI